MAKANGRKAETTEPQGEAHGGDRPRPAHEVRLGRVKAAVWANGSEHGVRYSVSVCRVYKDQDGKWRTSESFGREDLLVLAKVVDRAHTWICEQTQNADVPI